MERDTKIPKTLLVNSITYIFIEPLTLNKTFTHNNRYNIRFKLQEVLNSDEETGNVT